MKIAVVVMVVGSSAKFRPEQAVEPRKMQVPKTDSCVCCPDAPEALNLLSNNIACFRTLGSVQEC